jgi:hypothetical protein
LFKDYKTKIRKILRKKCFCGLILFLNGEEFRISGKTKYFHKSLMQKTQGILEICIIPWNKDSKL